MALAEHTHLTNVIHKKNQLIQFLIQENDNLKQLYQITQHNNQENDKDMNDYKDTFPELPIYKKDHQDYQLDYATNVSTYDVYQEELYVEHQTLQQSSYRLKQNMLSL